MKQLVDSPPTPRDAGSAAADHAEAADHAGAACRSEVPGVPEADGLLDLGRAATLGFVVGRRRRASVAAAEEMAGVCHWADLHRLPTPAPETVDAEFGCIGRETVALLDDPGLDPARRAWGGPGDPDGVEASLRLFGEGAYLVAEFAVTEVAAALGMSESAARCYVGECLETRDRLPRLWARVQAGDLEGWKARRIARTTIPLNAEAAAFVDLSLHRVAHRIGTVRIDRVVEAAVLRFDPETAAERAAAAAQGRRVRITHGEDGVSFIDGVTATPDAVAFDQALSDVAAALGALGDEDSFEVRRAKAFGILADPQHALDLHTTAEATPAEDPESGRRRRRVPRSTLGPQIHLHLHARPRLAQTADTVETAAPVGPVVRVEVTPGRRAQRGTGCATGSPIGPRSLAAVQSWLADLAPGAVLKLTPVIDTGADIAVDAHEIPAVVAAQVEERDLVCQFPWCSRQSRHDKDHIEPYRDPDDGGPPDQTRAVNLARLCRFHHRVKTHSRGPDDDAPDRGGPGWHYQREPDAGLTWTSPHGLRYRVDPTGTRRLD